jgi:hypothetical protein
MLTRSTYMLYLITLLSSCVSDPLAQQKQATKLMEYKVQVYGPACEKLGFEKNTNEWRECIQREYEQTLIRQQNLLDNFYWNQYYSHPYYYQRR